MQTSLGLWDLGEEHTIQTQTPPTGTAPLMSHLPPLPVHTSYHRLSPRYYYFDYCCPVHC